MILGEVESKFNGRIKVVWSLGLGKYIQAGGLTQSGGIVESIWRDALKKVNSKKKNAKSVLILGLGGGSAAKVVHKNWPEARITGVDIDRVIVELGKRYLGLDKVEVEIKIEDAYEFTSNRKYDLVLVDLYNGDKFPEKFEKNEFIGNIKKILGKNGIIVFNRLYGSDHRNESMMFGRKLETNFVHVDYMYPQANVALICYN